MMHLIDFIKRLSCKHHYARFVRNISGEEITRWAGDRSIWRCHDCGSYYSKPILMKQSFPTPTKEVLTNDLPTQRDP